MPDDLHWKTAAELGEFYRSRDVSPVEAVDAALDRMEKVDPALNIMVTVTAEHARAQAKEAERRFLAGDELPPLYGVPMTVKDLAETAGVRTTYGSVAYQDHVPDEDAIGWARLKEQGAILLGKTTTPEFGLLGVTESKLTGTTNNPWNPGHTPGGSSGGAAAAVAAGVGPIAWGSDGGGSIRVPSALCGVVGIKPSIGRIPAASCTDGDSTDGPIARTVLDAALVFDATNGHHPSDRFSVPRDARSYVEAAREPGDLSGVRIAACRDVGQKVLDDDVRAVFDQALEDLRAAGAVVEEVGIDLPDTFEYFDHLNGLAYLEFCEEMQAAEIEVWPMIVEFAERAKHVTARQVHTAHGQGKTDIYNGFMAAMAGADLMVTPTTAVAAFPHGGHRGPMRLVGGQEAPPLALLIHAMTEPPAHAGLPAISVPGGFNAEGLPIGLQFIGRLWADADVVSVAARYERTTDWHLRHPDL